MKKVIKTSGVKIAKKIRGLARLSKYQMAFELFRSWESYKYLEEKGEVFTALDIVELYRLSGMSLEDFWNLIVDEAEKLRKLKKRTKGKPSKLR